MPRIRSIHPGLFTDEAYMEMSPYAMAAWPGLWCQCDDQGVFEWKPVVLKARLLPGTSIDFSGLLDEWTKLGVVRAFDEAGKRFGAVKNFRKFQRPKKPVITFPLPIDLAAFVGMPAGSKPPLSGIPSQQSEDETDVQGSHLPPESRVVSEQREEGGDKMEEVESVCDAPARPLRLVTPEATSLAEACLQSVGLTIATQPERLSGLVYQAQVWIARGYDPPSVVATFANVFARYGPNKPLSLFISCIEGAQSDAQKRADSVASEVVTHGSSGKARFGSSHESQGKTFGSYAAELAREIGEA